MHVKGVELLLQHSKCLSLHQTALHQTAPPAPTYDIVFCSIACDDPNHKSAGVAGLCHLCISLSICSVCQFACVYAHLPGHLSVIVSPACPICLFV